MLRSMVYSEILQDPTLERCFGRKDKIIDLEWTEIEPLRTVQEPGEPMPQLRELLEYLTEPGLEDIWVLLDIKVGFVESMLEQC
jgi:phosphatidylglycerol phospholipase C